jgi:putative hydrolase of the HAD superfamily
MRAVVFDFSGVLLHWQPQQLLREVVPELAPDEPAAQALAARIFQSFTPGSDWSRFDLGAVGEEMLAQRIAARIGAAAAQVRRVIDAIPAHLEARRESVALFRRVKAAGHRTFFLSNMPEPYARHLEQTHDFISEFDGGIFSGRVRLMKPDSAIFELAETTFALDPRHTLFIDDHAGNVDAARARGWQALHFRAGAADAERDLRAAGWL